MKKTLNSKKVLLILLLITSSYSLVGVQIKAFSDNIIYDDLLEKNIEDKKENDEELSEEVENIYIDKNNKSGLSSNKNVSKNKYRNEKLVLKKEIQNRKRLHKTLLQAYNENFDNNILTQITNNSLFLEGLKNKYKQAYFADNLTKSLI